MGILDFFISPDVAKMKRNNDIAGLIRSLQHNDKSIQELAAKALAGVPDEKAIKALKSYEYKQQQIAVAAKALEFNNNVKIYFGSGCLNRDMLTSKEIETNYALEKMANFLADPIVTNKERLSASTVQFGDPDVTSIIAEQNFLKIVSSKYYWEHRAHYEKTKANIADLNGEYGIEWATNNRRGAYSYIFFTSDYDLGKYLSSYSSLRPICNNLIAKGYSSFEEFLPQPPQAQATKFTCCKCGRAVADDYHVLSKLSQRMYYSLDVLQSNEGTGSEWLPVCFNCFNGV